MSRLAKRTKDPTKTAGLRRKAYADIKRRFNEIKKVVKKTVVETPLLVANASVADASFFEYRRDDEKLNQFNRWLKVQIDEEILNHPGGRENHWLNVTIGRAYDRGARRARVEATRQLKLDPILAFQLDGFNPLLNPAHVDRAALIYTRVFQDLEGVTNAMASQMSRILAKGMLEGKNPLEVAKELADRVDKIGITRARTIARTEIIESHNRANIAEAEELEKLTGLTVKMRWLHASGEAYSSPLPNDRVDHFYRHNKLFKKEDALPLLGLPNCRCGLAPVFEEND